AQFAAFQRVLTTGTTDRQSGEVGALLQLLIDLLGHLTLAAGLFAAGGLRYRQYYHRQTVVGGGLVAAHLGVEEVAHFLVADLDALGHPALAHTVDDQFPAYLFPGLVVADAIALQRGAELFQ